jgi:hypothetical protein
MSKRKEIFITTRKEKTERMRATTDIWHRCVLFVVIIVLFVFKLQKKEERNDLFLIARYTSTGEEQVEGKLE